MYNSCAKALNYGAKIAKGNILIFAHQDIVFEKNNAVLSLANYISNNANNIVGIFGAKKDINDTSTYCDTIDECCFGMTKKLYERLQFNEEICDNWHLYAVEMCLRWKKENIGTRCYNLGISHMSGGVVNKSYMKTFKNF